MCVLELERSLPSADAEPPDAPGEIADAVTALRLATAGPIAAGPVLFERLDWRPFGVRPDAPDRRGAASRRADPARRLSRRGRAKLLRERLALAEDDRELGEALDRWELSLFQDAPFRAEQLRSALDALLGAGDGSWAAALRAAVLLGENGRERATCSTACGRLPDGVADDAAADLVRRVLVETLSRGDRAKLVAELDESLLGVRARPAGRVAARGGKLIQTWHIRGDVARLPWKPWSTSAQFWSGSSGSTACGARTRRREWCSRRGALTALGRGGLGARRSRPSRRALCTRSPCREALAAGE